MIVIRETQDQNSKKFDKRAKHPLQSWSWGNFRKKTGGVEVSRYQESSDVADEVYQITWHKIPKTKYVVGYCPKSSIPSVNFLSYITKEAKKRDAIFVKFEPNALADKMNLARISHLEKEGWLVKGKPLFTKHTFWMDLAKGEDSIFQSLSQKTRYNIRLAIKKGVKVEIDNSDKGFDEYWKLTEETTKRQGFYAHSKNYHQKMWNEIIGEGKGVLMKGVYNDEVLATWILFELNGVLYYPYGASSSKHREVMVSNLMMWEAIRYGIKQGCKLLDMWGSLGPDPDIKDPWYGFHKFKQGYNPALVEFVGTYDLVVNKPMYHMFLVGDKLRWLVLKMLKRIRK